MSRIQLSDHFTYKRLFRFIWPSIAMMIFTSIYGVVDGIFVSNFAAKTAFAGLNFIMPLVMIINAPGFMLGIGGTALVSKTLGEGDRQRANRLFSLFCIAAVINAVILGTAAYILMPAVAALMGAKGELLYYSVLYGRIVLFGCVPQTLHFVFEGFMVAAERPDMGLKATVAAGVTNIILDALFVGAFGWGIVGAAWATVIGQCVGGFTPLVFFLRPNNSLLKLTRTRFDGKALLKGCTNGSSELMSNISMSLIGMLYNIQLMKYLGENGVAAYGVMMYVNFVFISAFIGYSIGVSPVVGFNFGARNRGELHNILIKSIIVLGVGGVCMFLLGEGLSGTFAAIFTSRDKNLFELTVHGFRIFSVSFLTVGFAIFGSAFFTALNDGLTSAIISFMRTLVFQLAAVIVLPVIMGPDGIWYSVVVAEVMAVMLSCVFLFAKRKKYGYFEAD